MVKKRGKKTEKSMKGGDKILIESKKQRKVKRIKRDVKNQHSEKNIKLATLGISNDVKLLEHLDKREQILVSNFVALQKVMTNLSSKIDDMTSKLSKLLDVFEISAKALAEKNFEFSTEKNDENFLKKLDILSEQNKIIARGLTLLHEKSGEGEETYIPKNYPPVKPMNPHIAQGYKSSLTPIVQPQEIIKPQFAKQLPQNPNLESATSGYKSATFGKVEEIERPLPPEEESP